MDWREEFRERFGPALWRFADQFLSRQIEEFIEELLKQSRE
jgi:hypothetical protein